MSKKENTRRTARAQRFTIIGKYSNAGIFKQGEQEVELNDGDVCYVKPGAPYKDNDLVVIKCRCCLGRDEVHYHARYYVVVNGKKYKFRLGGQPYATSGQLFKEGQESIIVGPVVKVTQKNKKQPDTETVTTTRGKITIHTAGFDWDFFEIHDGDRIRVAYGAKPALGDLILIKEKADSDPLDDVYFNRVCRVDGQMVRVASDKREPHDVPLSLVVGVALDDVDHSECVQGKLAALRARLARIDADDITDSTARYAVEREIYDLEHPKAEEDECDDSDEWPEDLDG